MLFGIECQLTILVIMLVSSTGLTSGLAGVDTHICTRTYTHTRKSVMIIIYYIIEKGGYIQYV